MASVTLAESAKLSQDMLIAGVIANVITVNQMYEMIPFDGITGNSLAYNRENVLGDTQVLGVGGTITAKAAATFTKVNSDLTTIIGDAEVNGLIQATRSNVVSQEATQVASKAKSAGRQFQDMFVNGTGASDQFPGLIQLCPAGQTLSGQPTDGEALSFTRMDELLDRVIAKDGQVDFLMFNSRTLRSYKALVRGLGGITADDVYEMPSGRKIIAYSGVPIFRNDWVPINQTKGSTTTATTIFAGCWDDGSQKVGITGITAEESAGLVVEDVGISQTKDERITRVKWYVGMALFSEKALAMAPGITN
jgi:hypothetical protein